jgi:hypothetical protein
MSRQLQLASCYPSRCGALWGRTRQPFDLVPLLTEIAKPIGLVVDFLLTWRRNIA